MKPLLTLCLFICTIESHGQSLQLHYDFRHTLDPAKNSKNYPTVYFEFFKIIDSGKGFIKPGSFLIKMQADFQGGQHNIGNYFMQVSQEFRCWEPKIFLSLQYSGGLGVTDPRQYSYYNINTFSVGCSYPFRWGQAYLSSVLYFKYVPYTRPTKDLLFTLYFYKGLLGYKASLSGDFSIWTENKNHGDDLTKDFSGKRFYFFAEPQFWVGLTKTFSVGTKVNIYYHVLLTGDHMQVYPTLAIKVSFSR